MSIGQFLSAQHQRAVALRSSDSTVIRVQRINPRPIDTGL